MAGLPVQSPQDETLTQVFLTHLVGVFFKQNYPKYISDVVSKILEGKKKKKKQLSDVLSEFVIFLKLGVLVVKVESLYFQFFSSFTEPILADF